jgi:hypothetical protein
LDIEGETNMNARIVFPIIGLALMAGPVLAEDAPDWSQTGFFTPPADAAPAAPFAGRVDMATVPMTVTSDPEDGFISTPWAWWGVFDFLAAQDPEGAVPLFELDAGVFPGLSVGFSTDAEGRLLPDTLDIIRRPIESRTASFWELIVGPGQTWAVEAGDYAGWNRASFPLSLVQSQGGEAWVGLGAFHYRDGEVSDLYMQVGPVSAGGFIFWDADFDATAWAQVPLEVTAEDHEAAGTGLADVGNAALTDMPGAAEALAPFLARENLLALAVLDDGTLYHSDVDTPFGLYPYPEAMRVGVWSVTKSLIPGMAALRLAQVYGQDFLDRPLVSFFDEGEFDYADAAAKARWQEVTLRNALHMKTGMGPNGSDANWAMDSANTYEWSYSYAVPDQIARYFAQGINPEVGGPGESLVYVDQDMWIATLAMQRFLQQQEGPEATILAMLQDEVYDPIGAGHLAAGTSYTDTGAPGLPYAAWGALPTMGLLARAGELVANGGKGPNGAQILHPELVEAFFADAEYRFAFWSQTVEHDGQTLHLPKMSGAGGNYVLSLPDGRAIVVLSRDSYNVDWSDEELNALAKAVLSL